MKRKTLLPLLLVLTLLVSVNALAIQIPPELLQGLGMSSGEPAEITVKEDRFNRFNTILGLQAEYVLIVENPGTAPIYLGESKVDLLDKDGAVVTSSPIYSMSPSTLMPGETGYIVEPLYSILAEDAGRVASYQATVAAVTVPGNDPAPVVKMPVTVDFTTGEGSDVFTGEKEYTLSIVNTVENNTDKDAFDVRVFNVLRDKDGKLLSIAGSTTMDVGIPAGGKILLKSNVQTGLVTMLHKFETLVATVEGFAFREAAE